MASPTNPAASTAAPSKSVPRTPILRIRMAGNQDEAPVKTPSTEKPRNAFSKLHFSSPIMLGSTTPSEP